MLNAMVLAMDGVPPSATQFYWKQTQALSMGKAAKATGMKQRR